MELVPIDQDSNDVNNLLSELKKTNPKPTTPRQWSKLNEGKKIIIENEKELYFLNKKKHLESIQERDIYKKAFQFHQRAIKNYLITRFKNKFIINYTLYNNIGDNHIQNETFNLIDNLDEIEIRYPFKITSSLGYFFHDKNDEICYFHSSDNNFTLPFNVLIKNKNELKKYINKIKNYDLSPMFEKYGMKNILLTNITFYVYRLIGGKWIKKKIFLLFYVISQKLLKKTFLFQIIKQIIYA